MPRTVAQPAAAPRARPPHAATVVQRFGDDDDFDWLDNDPWQRRRDEELFWREQEQEQREWERDNKVAPQTSAPPSPLRRRLDRYALKTAVVRVPFSTEPGYVTIQDTSIPPFNAIGRILVSFNGAADAASSGALIAPNLVLTCAHAMVKRTDWKGSKPSSKAQKAFVSRKSRPYTAVKSITFHLPAHGDEKSLALEADPTEGVGWAASEGYIMDVVSLLIDVKGYEAPPSVDLAVIRLEKEVKHVSPLPRGSSLSNEGRVTVVGYPGMGGLPTMRSSTGTITGVSNGIITTNGAMQSGFSGSPAFHHGLPGTIIGVVSQGTSMTSERDVSRLVELSQERLKLIDELVATLTKDH